MQSLLLFLRFSPDLRHAKRINCHVEGSVCSGMRDIAPLILFAEKLSRMLWGENVLGDDYTYQRREFPIRGRGAGKASAHRLGLALVPVLPTPGETED